MIDGYVASLVRPFHICFAAWCSVGHKQQEPPYKCVDHSHDETLVAYHSDHLKGFSQKMKTDNIGRLLRKMEEEEQDPAGDEQWQHTQKPDM